MTRQEKQRLVRDLKHRLIKAERIQSNETPAKSFDKLVILESIMIDSINLMLENVDE